MDPLDVGIVVAALLAAVGGYRLGFFTRVLSWVGLAVGIALAARFSSRIVSSVHLSDAGERLALAFAVLIGGAFVGQAVGMLAGARIHAVLPLGPLRSADKAVGGAVGIIGVLVALWLLLPSFSSVAGWPARVTRESVISRWVGNDLPAPPDTLQSLRRLVGNDEFPQVFNSLEPGPSVGAVPSANPLGAALSSRVAASTVEVEGPACGRIQEGSGFAVAPGLIVTNAHVVAGEPAGTTAVLLPSGLRLAARVVLYDPDRDLAFLQVTGLGEPPLPVGTGTVGSSVTVFGHPNGQTALALQPASIAQEIPATGRDLYDRHDTRRDVYVLAASLAPDDSGGAPVDTCGDVVGVAFAIALDHPDEAYALTSREVDEDLAAPRTGQAVSTEACLRD
jgi:S1-C subfamily serine protease